MTGERRTLGAFIGVTFIGSVGVAICAWASIAPPMLLGIAAMFLPALGVLVARALGAPLGSLRWKAPLTAFGLALLALPVAVHVSALPATMALEGRLPWSPWLVRASDGLFHAPPELGWGDLTPLGLAARLAINAIVGLLVVSILAFFEEIGWRAWLLPRLVRLRGERVGALASAAIWAAWHTPYAVSGLHHVDNVSTAALCTIAPLGHIGAGLFLAWIYLRWRSIAVVALAHGSLNSWSQFAFKYMTTTAESDTALLAVVNLAMLAVGLLLLMTLPMRQTSTAVSVA